MSASVNLPLQSRSSLLVPADLGGPRKRAIKRLWCGGVGERMQRPFSGVIWLVRTYIMTCNPEGLL